MFVNMNAGLLTFFVILAIGIVHLLSNSLLPCYIDKQIVYFSIIHCFINCDVMFQLIFLQQVVG